MKSREIPGGTGPDSVAAALERARQLLGASDRMTKTYRQGQILKLIRSQEDLDAGGAGAGAEGIGIAATQVTLSRDMRELRLVKTREGYQEMAAEETGPGFSHAGGRVSAGRVARRRIWWC